MMMLYGKVLGFLMCMYQNILSFLDENIIGGRLLTYNLLLVSPTIKVCVHVGTFCCGTMRAILVLKK